MSSNNSLEIWDAMITIAQWRRAKAAGEGLTNEGKATVYRAIYTILQVDHDRVSIAYNLGLVNLNIVLQVDMAAWKADNPPAGVNINALKDRDSDPKYRQELKVLGFTEEEIDEFLSDS